MLLLLRFQVHDFLGIQFGFHHSKSPSGAVCGGAIGGGGASATSRGGEAADAGATPTEEKKEEKEESDDDMRIINEVYNDGPRIVLVNLLTSLRHLPPAMHSVLIVMALTWVYHGDPKGNAHEVQLYNEGVSEGAFGLLLNWVLSAKNKTMKARQRHTKMLIEAIN